MRSLISWVRIWLGDRTGALASVWRQPAFSQAPRPQKRSRWVVIVLFVLRLVSVAAALVPALTPFVLAPEYLPLAFLGAIAAVWLLYHAQLWLLAREFGPVLVTTPEGAGDHDATLQVGALLRSALTGVALYAPATSVPAGSPTLELLTVLEKGGPENRLVAILLRAGQQLSPTHAFRVQGALLRREGNASYGLSVQLERVGTRWTASETFWAASWEATVSAAASAIAAWILPRSRRCAHPPWSGWQRLEFPPELLAAYQEAEQAADARRYDCALAAYHRALHDDPLNLDLRIEVGQLQEKLALYLDALSTYSGVCRLANMKLPSYWRHPFRWRSVRRTRKRSVFIAQYRRVLIFGFGEKLAKQWCKEPQSQVTQTKRDLERDALRIELTPVLKALDFFPNSQRELDMREFFQQIASKEVARLARSYSELELHRLETGLTKTSLRLCESWANLRLRWARSLAQPGAADRSDWPPQFTDVEQALDPLKRAWGNPLKWLGHSRLTWLDHYNAGCTWALGLLGTRPEDAELAKRAIYEFERFASLADRALVFRLRPWIVSEDPDLEGLRRTAPFKAFEARHFPAPEPTPERTADVHIRELVFFTTTLVRRTARLLEDIWHSHGLEAEAGADIHLILRWWREEQDAWRYARVLAENHNHWPSRVEIVDAINDWCDRYHLARPELPHPRWTEEVHNGLVQKVDVREIDIRVTDSRFEELGQLIDQKIEDQNRRWETYLKRVDREGRPIPRQNLLRLCRQRAALWDTLAESFSYKELVRKEPMLAPFTQQLRALKGPPRISASRE